MRQTIRIQLKCLPIKLRLLAKQAPLWDKPKPNAKANAPKLKKGPVPLDMDEVTSGVSDTNEQKTKALLLMSLRTIKPEQSRCPHCGRCAQSLTCAEAIRHMIRPTKADDIGAEDSEKLSLCPLMPPGMKALFFHYNDHREKWRFADTNEELLDGYVEIFSDEKIAYFLYSLISDNDHPNGYQDLTADELVMFRGFEAPVVFDDVAPFIDATGLEVGFSANLVLRNKRVWNNDEMTGEEFLKDLLNKRYGREQWRDEAKKAKESVLKKRSGNPD